MDRVYSIDYLRGILAFLIMIYHYSSWQKIFILDASSSLTRIALYGVSIFFIISGFSLTLTYFEKFKNLNLNLFKNYIYKRFARIYPLFWLIVILYLSFLLVGHRPIPELLEILSNLTITFAFFDSYAGFTAGSWSIGLEIIFYIMLPFCLYAIHKYFKLSIFILIVFIIFSIYISAYTMYEESNLSSYWNTYMKIINHLYFFIFGILLAILYIKKESLVINKTILIFSIFMIIALVAFYPIEGESGYLVYEGNRVFLTLASFTLFTLVVMINAFLKQDKMIMHVLEYFGAISYTLYLLHPIVYMIIKNTLFKIIFIEFSILQNIIMIIITIILSNLIFSLYEMPLKKLLLLRLSNEKK